MKFYFLKQLTQYLSNFQHIKYIKRVDNNIIKIEFENKNIFYFDVTKSNSLIYKKNSTDNIKKDFNAPFDVILTKRFINSKIKNIYLHNNDKILRIEVHSGSSYKIMTTVLQIEFTGKFTNIIILDKNNIILEALRHIDEYSSTRVIKVGLKLQELEKPNFNYEEKAIDNIEQYLFDIYTKKELQELNSLKKQKLNTINKHLKKLLRILNSLDNVETLKEHSIKYNDEATNILNELYKYTGYEKQIKIKLSNELFTKSKKTKQKAKNQYLEKNNLEQKINFFTKLKSIIETATTIHEIEFYLPKKDKNRSITKKSQPYQSFFIDGYKIMLGRDERENIYLLQNARASDFWFHLQGQVSSHVIVPTKKKTLPPHILEEAAKICARFSTSSGGVYTIDFTQRRNVKIQNKANVLYNPYSSIPIKI